jgi:hypothetical protein
MSADQVAAKDDTICRSYGAKPGTDVYIQCRMSVAQQRQSYKLSPL